MLTSYLNDWLKTFSDHPTEWLLTLFNLFLVFYTARLYQATRALAGADRPHLLANTFVFDQMRHAPDADGNIETLFSYRFQNYGRSPAFVQRYAVRQAIVDHIGDLPARPDYDTPVVTRYIIAPNVGWYGSVEPSKVKVPRATVAEILSGAKKLVIFGFIEYGDFAGRETFKVRYAFSFGFGSGEKSERYFPVGPDSYWEYT